MSTERHSRLASLFVAKSMIGIHQITPFIHVPNLEEALHLLCDVLEFEVKYREPGYAYCELQNSGLRILEETGRHVSPDGRSRMTVYVDVSNVDELFERYSAKLNAVPRLAVEPPRDKPWKQREFMVKLPDGDWIAFGEARAVNSTPLQRNNDETRK